jgi:HTH-type transcriptional regulator/antitoxin HigA
MEQTGLTRADLARLLGSPERARDFLARRKGLSLPMARRLHREWGIPAESLLGSLPAKPRATRAAARSRAIVRAAGTRA